MIWPGPSFPFSMTFFSSYSYTPISDATVICLSSVIIYLAGRNPFLSVTQAAYLPSVKTMPAGPSQDSICFALYS